MRAETTHWKLTQPQLRTHMYADRSIRGVPSANSKDSGKDAILRQPSPMKLVDGVDRYCISNSVNALPSLNFQSRTVFRPMADSCTRCHRFFKRFCKRLVLDVESSLCSGS